jgi:Recombinase
LGYRNNKQLCTIELDPDNAPIAQRMFELYATGSYSLATLRLFLKAEYGKVLSKWHLEKLLKSPFYIGTYEWEGKSKRKRYPAPSNVHRPFRFRPAFPPGRRHFENFPGHPA